MIKEKMIELLVLSYFFEKYIDDDEASIGILNDKKHDLNEMKQRLNQLLEEFLEPYVIESDSKE